MRRQRREEMEISVQRWAAALSSNVVRSPFAPMDRPSVACRHSLRTMRTYSTDQLLEERRAYASPLDSQEANRADHEKATPMVANVVAHCEGNSCVASARGSVCRVSLLGNAGRKPPHASEIFVTISPHELDEQACIANKERRVLPSCDTPPVCEAGARLRSSAGGFFFHSCCACLAPGTTSMVPSNTAMLSIPSLSHVVNAPSSLCRRLEGCARAPSGGEGPSLSGAFKLPRPR